MRDSARLQLAFFSSGAAALLFEVLWFRSLGRLLGNTMWAAALVLTAFMLGIALGGLLAARWTHRVRNPARAFAIAEVTVGITGCLVVLAIPVLEAPVGQLLSPLVEHPVAMAAVRLALALAAMLLPTIAMGLTLPLGVRALAKEETTRVLGRLYAANTFGACLAPMIAELYLVEWLGLRGTALAALLLNLAAAGTAWRMPVAAASAAAPARSSGGWNVRLLLAAALAGALALGLEVVWFRLLLLHAPATDATFALLLLLMLAGIGLGGLAARAVSRLHGAWVAAAGACAVVIGYLISVPSLGGRFGDVVWYAVLLMLPAALVSGALFTLFGSALRGQLEDPQPAIGRLTFANTLGAAGGAAVTGFLILPVVGIEKSLFALAAGYALLALLLVQDWRAPARPLLAVALAGVALLAFPFGRIERHLDRASAVYRLDGSRVVQTIEGPTMTLQVMRTDRFGEPVAWRLLTDNYSITSTTRYALRYMQLFAWLPQSLHPDPQRALLISYGVGNTARALLDDSRLRQLTVVDISPEILAASRVVHGRDDPLAEPRVRLVIEDGRHFLRTRREQFDIITAEPPPPMMAGVVNLYTREYFAALAARLAPGGLATYWLPVQHFEPRGARSVVAAFCDAFPDCTLWSGAGYHWILMGGRGYEHRATAQQVAQLWEHPAGAERLEASGFEHPAQIGATFLADAMQLRLWVDGALPLTDDRPKRMAAIPIDRPTEDYLRLLEPQAAARNFSASGWVAAHWPRELLPLSMRLFGVQSVLNGQIPGNDAERLVLLDALLRSTPFAIPVLWLLNTDMTEQRIVGRQLAARGFQPEYAYTLGARALARRDYAEAADLLVEAAKLDAKQTGALAAYAACRAGVPAKAAAAPGADLLPATMRCWKVRNR